MERPRTYRTQGIKGAKAPRINMAFDPDIYSYIRAEAEQQHTTMTCIVNGAVREQMARNEAEEERA